MTVEAARLAWLRSIYDFTRQHGQGPNATDLAKVHGTSRQAQNQRILALASVGMIQLPHARKGQNHPMIARLSPMAMFELNIAPVVYLAWPASFTDDGTWLREDDGGADAARWLFEASGISALSPYVAGWPHRSIEHGIQLAERSDAVVVVDDPLLLGRADVASAMGIGLSISVVRRQDRSGVRSATDLWTPPLLLPGGLK